MPEPDNAPAPITREEFDTAINKINELEQSKNELQSKLEVTSEALEEAMADMANKGRAPQGNPDDPNPPALVPNPKPAQEPDNEFEKEVDKSIKEDEEFRNDIRGFKERVEAREEALALNEEINKALVDNPLARREEILMAVEAGREEDKPDQVAILAKQFNDNRAKEYEEIKTKVAGELEQKFKAEREGTNYIPQSQGTAPSSPPPGNGTPGQPPVMTDADPWGTALQAAKKATAPGE